MLSGNLASRRSASASICLLLLLATAGVGADTEPVAPDAVEGLLAWYDARSLYDVLRNREAVSRYGRSRAGGRPESRSPP